MLEIETKHDVNTPCATSKLLELRRSVLAVAGLLCALSATACATVPRSISFARTPRLAVLPDARLHAVACDVSRSRPSRSASLKIPAPGRGWQPVKQLPDDSIVVRVVASPPSQTLRCWGRRRSLHAGRREMQKFANGSPPQGHKGALNRPGRDNYGGHGYLPVYPAWYQQFNFDSGLKTKDKSVWLDFGGVYRDAVIFVNGRFIDQQPHASGLHGISAVSISLPAGPLRRGKLSCGVRGPAVVRGLVVWRKEAASTGMVFL